MRTNILFAPAFVVATVSSAIFFTEPPPAASQEDLQSPVGDEASPPPTTLEEVLDLPAYRWLKSKKRPGRIRSYDGGSVQFRGYFLESELTPERLDAFNRYSLFPNWINRDDELSVDRLQTFQVSSQPDPAVACVGLVQVVGYIPRAQRDEESAELVEAYSNWLPSRPLDRNCDFTEPTMPQDFEERRTFKLVGGPVLREKQRPCADFAGDRNDRIILSKDMRFDIRRIAVGSSMPKTDLHYPSTFFDMPFRGFTSALHRGGMRNLQYLVDGNYAPRPQDVSIEYRVVEDEQADRFCIVMDLRQGNAERRFRRVEPRQGRALPWHAGPRGGPMVYVPDNATLVDFGTEIADTILVENGLVPRAIGQ